MTNSNRDQIWPWAAVLSAAVLAVYASAFRGGFLYDDLPIVVYNAALRDWSRPDRVLFAIEGRPVVSLSFALDWQLFGAAPLGYHFVNVGAHLISALSLFGLIRRMLHSEALRARFGAAAEALAFGAALIWALHPLQTEAVTYIVQRCECLMGMFALLALYAFARAADSPRAMAWNLTAIFSTALAAGCKQTAVVLPILALIYDASFISGTFSGALKRSGWTLAGMCSGFVVAGVFLWAAFAGAGGSQFKLASIGTVSRFDYLKSQCVVILHYLRLAVWPVGQCFDYDWPVETDWTRILPAAAALIAVFGATVWQVLKKSVWGFWVAFFFLTLGPTSSLLPISDLACERRMYLPLAGVVAPAVLVLGFLLRKLSGRMPPSFLPAAIRILAAFSVVIALPLGWLTVERNACYRDALTMWLDVATKRPKNAHAREVVGALLLEKGEGDTARVYLAQALALKPDYVEARGMLGAAFLQSNDFVHAEAEFKKALESDPGHPQSLFGMVDALEGQGRREDAFKALVHAAEMQPEEPQIQSRLGDALFALGRPADALQAYLRAAGREPVPPNLYNGLGCALAALGKFPEAQQAFERAIAIQPRDAATYYNFGTLLDRASQPLKAIAAYRAALDLDPNRADAANALAWILSTSNDATIRNGASALALAEKACTLTQRKQPLMLDTLAAAYAETGRFDDARAALEAALKFAPAGSAMAMELNTHLALIDGKKPIRAGK